MNKIIGLILVVLVGYFAVMLYGNHRYEQGVAHESAENEKSRKEYEDAANTRIAAARAESVRNQSETARVSKLVTVLESDNRDRRASIAGLLNAINHARPQSAGGGADDRETEWIGLFRSCSARAESLSGRLGELGNEAAEMADQVNGLMGYVRAAKKGY